MEPRIGIDDGRRATAETGRREISEIVTHVMADTYVLYFQTQSFHWNVRGPHFHSLHKMFEEQYDQLAEAVDVLAERVRALGALAPTSLGQIASIARIPLDHGAPGARGMVEILLRGHEHLARDARRAAQIADDAGDGVTHDMLIARADEHEKTAWMLRATLDE
ncbi:Dps family protein [Sandaracinus amylolyticus]|uniref:Dps family protein n=1 Tax=Sandaracinus amylolyticus TaxID=927083 RepID=UPI001F401D82|nr:DNA starvation/stationary phase protection protein [Sandaracinus amylolyticus]UJR82006.1 Non-specific DNA-binding protein Dps [Sandaracinus amylolyticus]